MFDLKGLVPTLLVIGFLFGAISYGLVSCVADNVSVTIKTQTKGS